MLSLKSFAIELISRLTNIVFALDCFFFSIATLGNSFPYESFSSAAYRAEKFGMFYGKARPIIDKMFWFDKNHCQRAYTQCQLNLPPEQRQ